MGGSSTIRLDDLPVGEPGSPDTWTTCRLREPTDDAPPIEPDFVGDDFDPVLRTRQFDLATADARDADLPLIPVDGLRIDTGFCDVADFLDGQLVCDRAQDSPILVDVDDAVTTAVPSIAFGTVRFRASQ